MLWSVAILAQRNVRDSLQFQAIGVHLGTSLPLADLGKRFGFGGHVGGALYFKTKNNITIEASYSYHYSNRVKEDTILDPLMTDQGFIIDRDGYPADVYFLQSMHSVSMRLGKVFPVIGPNVNSGLNISLGAGYLQHKIQINHDRSDVPQLQNGYTAGYDRLTSGMLFDQSIGYQHFSSYRYINYYIGMTLTEAITRNRRGINYDTGRADNRTRLDMLFALTFRWYFPFYKRQPRDFYFY
ncbi:MAG: hypothetical protein Kow0075_10510 [Salibacteraceae bacterium]